MVGLPKCDVCKEGFLSRFGESWEKGMCGACYKTVYADQVADASEKDKARVAPCIAWEKEWAAAVDGKDVAKLEELLNIFKATRDDASGEDKDDALSKRHATRMKIAILASLEATFAQASLLLLTAKLTSFIDTAEIWKSFWFYYRDDRRGGPGQSAPAPAPVGYEHQLSAFDKLIEYEEMATSAALDNECLCERIYSSDALEWCKKLLQPRFQDVDQIFVTAKHIKWAEHRMARTNGGKSPAKMAVLQYLQAQQKERNKKQAAKRKAEREAEEAEAGPAPPEPPPAKRSTRGSGAPPPEEPVSLPARKRAKTAKDAPAEEEAEWACVKEDKMAGSDEMYLMSASKWSKSGEGAAAWPEVWTCGLMDPRHPPDHATHSASTCKAGYEACKALEKQLGGWKPEHHDDKWQVFLIRPETLAANAVDTHDVCKAASTVMGAECHVAGDAPPRGLSSEIQTQALGDSRSTFFDQRFYYTFRVDTKALAKVKTATNHIKKMTEKGSCFFIQFAHKESCTVAPRCLIVGKSKPQYCEGGLLVVSFVDRDQDHYHHGSIKRRD